MTSCQYLLSDPANTSYISWNASGDEFRVCNPSEFALQVLPQQFKHNNFCSFVRQLNIYGFHKTGGDAWVFKHEHGYFQRGRLDLLAKITRRKQTKRSAPSELEEDKPPKIAKTISTPTPNMPSNIPSVPSTPQQYNTPPTTISSPPTYQQINLNDTSNIIVPPQSLPAFAHTPSTPIPSEDILAIKSINETVLAELNAMRRKAQTQDSTIAWLIQELLKSKKEIEELKQTVKQLQAQNEAAQRGHFLELVRDQQQRKRELHLQLEQQLQSSALPLQLPEQQHPHKMQQHGHTQQKLVIATPHNQTEVFSYLEQPSSDVPTPDGSSSDENVTVIDTMYIPEYYSLSYEKPM